MTPLSNISLPPVVDKSTSDPEVPLRVESSSCRWVGVWEYNKSVPSRTLPAPSHLILIDLAVLHLRRVYLWDASCSHELSQFNGIMF